ncbi:hypothetical protein FWF74_01800, partial [Candidatus Saccharibacteria bacterium]|nr:hypothetical protein [Candidatus Saccharibacteria bacterium]
METIKTPLHTKKAIGLVLISLLFVAVLICTGASNASAAEIRPGGQQNNLGGGDCDVNTITCMGRGPYLAYVDLYNLAGSAGLEAAVSFHEAGNAFGYEIWFDGRPNSTRSYNAATGAREYCVQSWIGNTSKTTVSVFGNQYPGLSPWKQGYGRLQFDLSKGCDPGVQYRICADVYERYYKTVGAMTPQAPSGNTGAIWHEDGICYLWDVSYWELQPSVQIKSKNSGSLWSSTNIYAAPGEEVEWEHVARETKGINSSSTSPKLSWGYGNGSGSNSTLGSGLTVNAWDVFRRTHSQVVPSNATDGTQICSTTWVNPYRELKGSFKESGKVCAIVKAQWDIELQAVVKNNNTGSTATSTRTTVSNPSSVIARPGHTATWSYYAKNTIARTNRDITFKYWALGSAANTQGTLRDLNQWYSGRNPDSNFVSVGQQNYRAFTQDDVDHDFVSYLHAEPVSPAGQYDITIPIGVSVPYHYPGCDVAGNCQLPACRDGGSCVPDCTNDGSCPGHSTKSGVTPITEATKAAVSYGENFKFIYKLDKTGPTKTRAMSYQINYFVLTKDATIDSSIKGGTYVQSYWPVGCGGRGVSYGSHIFACDTNVMPSYYNNTWTPSSGVVLTINGLYDIAGLEYNGATSHLGEASLPDLQPGQQICSYITINNWSSYNGSIPSTRLSSNIACVEIVKQPQMQIRGADSYSGAMYWGEDGNCIIASPSGGCVEAPGGFESFPTSQERRGSWSQYGLLSNGNTKHFGSAGWTMSTHNTKYKSGCKLQFANTTS